MAGHMAMTSSEVLICLGNSIYPNDADAFHVSHYWFRCVPRLHKVSNLPVSFCILLPLRSTLLFRLRSKSVYSAVIERPVRGNGGNLAVPGAHLLPQICPHLGDSAIPGCPPVTLSELQILISNRDKSPPAKMDPLTCPLCPNDFKMPSELKEHFRSHPPPPQELRCWQSGCPFLSQDLNSFQSHLREHELTPVSCSHRSCRLLFPSHEEMSQHFRSHFPFHCNLCDYVSANTKVFSQHRKSHLITRKEPRPLIEDPAREFPTEHVSPS
ncbi:zinc finger protein 142-like, partial [Hyla sarda]|uniref:zinc finger protein 142-like n=1 Tax=Hyla sarda TaxID=327740 RepID=UPI0024C238C9